MMYPDMSPAVRKIAYQVFLWANVVLFVTTAAVAVITKELPVAITVSQTVVNAIGISVGFTAKSNVSDDAEDYLAPATLPDEHEG